MENISDEEIINLTIDDFRDLTPLEEQQDYFRRMLQFFYLIYQNQVEIK